MRRSHALAAGVVAALVLSLLGGPAQSSVTTVALVGDIACATTDPDYHGGYGRGELCRQRAVSDLVLPARISRVIALGDLQYEVGDHAQFVASYGPSFGRVRSKTLPICGNHEYDGPAGPVGYERYFGRSCGWYTTKVGTARFIMLDTNQPLGVGSPQYEFVRTTLNASRSTCVFLVGHHPRYSAGRHGDDARLDAVWDLGVAKGVTAMFSGHEHAAMRYKPRDASGRVTPSGMTQVVSGGGGKSVSPQVTTTSSLATYLPKLGVYEMTIDEASVRLAFRSRWWNVLDQVTLPCRRAL